MEQRRRLEIIALGVLITIIAAPLVLAQKGAARTTILGEVIDLTSYAEKGARGEEFAEAGKFRAEKGFPVGILESETDEVYIAVYRDPAPASGLETANERLAPLMGKEVVVQGKVHRSKGLNVVEIALVAEM